MAAHILLFVCVVVIPACLAAVVAFAPREFHVRWAEWFMERHSPAFRWGLLATYLCALTCSFTMPPGSFTELVSSIVTFAIPIMFFADVARFYFRRWVRIRSL